MDFTSEPGQRRSRIAPVIVAVLIAFCLGAGLMTWVVATRPAWLSAVLPGEVSTETASAQPVVAPTTIDTVTLSTRESNLAAGIAALEARTATIDNDTAAAADRAGQAEAILIAFAARRAIDRGVGLGYLEEQLRQRFGATVPRETMTVIRAARAPVTIEDLRESLDTITPALLGGRSDWWAGIGSELRNLFVIHRVGTPSPLPSDRLERARRLLNSGNVEAALAEVSRMPGAQAVQQWTDAAGRYVAAHRALDTLEAAAITGVIAQRRATPAAPSVQTAR